MTPTLLPAMAQSVFRPLKERLESSSEQPRTPDELRELLEACKFGARVLDDARQSLQEMLNRGVESQKLVQFLTEFEVAIQCAEEVIYPQMQLLFQIRVGDSVPPGLALPEEEKRRAQKLVEEFVERAAAMRRELDSFRRWLLRSRDARPIEAILNANPTAREAYIDSEEIMARLQANGDL
jgi:hypothetical protein